MINSKNSFQVRAILNHHVIKCILPGISDLTKEIKEGILEHKTKLESRLEKKEEAKVCLGPKL